MQEVFPTRALYLSITACLSYVRALYSYIYYNRVIGESELCEVQTWKRFIFFLINVPNCAMSNFPSLVGSRPFIDVLGVFYNFFLLKLIEKSCLVYNVISSPSQYRAGCGAKRLGVGKCSLLFIYLLLLGVVWEAT